MKKNSIKYYLTAAVFLILASVAVSAAEVNTNYSWHPLQEIAVSNESLQMVDDNQNGIIDKAETLEVSSGMPYIPGGLNVSGNIFASGNITCGESCGGGGGFSSPATENLFMGEYDIYGTSSFNIYSNYSLQLQTPGTEIRGYRAFDNDTFIYIQANPPGDGRANVNIRADGKGANNEGEIDIRATSDEEDAEILMSAYTSAPSDQATIEIEATSNNDEGEIRLWSRGVRGDIQIWADGDTQSELTLDSDQYMHINADEALWIDSGDCNGNCLDIAELFPVTGDVQQSEVVCINTEGKAEQCRNEYDSKVLGVVSTNPAIIIEGEEVILGNYNETAKKPIALKGRVPVKVDCSNPISRGDLLVSSSRKGYAMKLDLESEITWKQAVGTTIGKALEDCSRGYRTISMWI